MAAVTLDAAVHQRQEGESVLDALLRGGVAVPHSCKSGVCGSCLMRAAEGTVPARAQAGLKDSWKARGYFLACVCVPEGDLRVASVDDGAVAGTTIHALDYVTPDVLRVRLAAPPGFEFQAGQYLSLRNSDGLARSYSIASLPGEGFIELHVRVYAEGKMSGWLTRDAKPGQSVTIAGPFGACFYVPGRPDQPMLLAGTGTGLSPLYGVLRAALEAGHQGPIHIVHGAVRIAGLYLREELRAISISRDNVAYRAVVLDGAAPDVETGPIDKLAFAGNAKLTGWRAFLCGDPVLVQVMRKKAFLAGAAMHDIHADSFLPAG
ncbi:MAG: 2Fe-2S iron-sulfur cluster binding domain-containing protein [Acidobacteria bacterium]|nr:2Fe-2S iron-sulfur cluster binding domain-containing protein [Acidobacteriota bacterium]